MAGLRRRADDLRELLGRALGSAAVDATAGLFGQGPPRWMPAEDMFRVARVPWLLQLMRSYSRGRSNSAAKASIYSPWQSYGRAVENTKVHVVLN